MDTKNYTLSKQNLEKYGCSANKTMYLVRDRETGRYCGSVHKHEQYAAPRGGRLVIWEACRTWRDTNICFDSRKAAATWLVEEKRAALVKAEVVKVTSED